MPLYRALPIVAAAALAPCAAAQISPILQERSVLAQASVSSGDSDGDFDDSPGFGPFVRAIVGSASGPLGASALANAAQNSVLSSAVVSGTLSARSEVHTGTTFVTGEANSRSSLLFIFSLAAATPVQFSASGLVTLVGRNRDGEPSDLYGISSVRLLNSNTEETISGYTYDGDNGDSMAAFNGVLLAGEYVLLASTQAYGFSADLLGPPPRSGSSDVTATFSLAVVPAPGASILLGLGCLGIRRRRPA